MSSQILQILSLAFVDERRINQSLLAADHGQHQYPPMRKIAELGATWTDSLGSHIREDGYSLKVTVNLLSSKPDRRSDRLVEHSARISLFFSLHGPVGYSSILDEHSK